MEGSISKSEGCTCTSCPGKSCTCGCCGTTKTGPCGGTTCTCTECKGEGCGCCGKTSETSTKCCAEGCKCTDGSECKKKTAGKPVITADVKKFLDGVYFSTKASSGDNKAE